ncbi:hypothetical protein GCK32_005929 [Trichostrongylus colubriformis]|uniref:Uncharacterized protein n=1 Tax=Trichostrongylus colubriformis TaxID=6319 RepID=A0AAN8IE54_TRICO
MSWSLCSINCICSCTTNHFKLMVSKSRRGGRADKGLPMEEGELSENQAIKDELDERNLLEDMQSEELAMALGLDYGAGYIIKEEPLSITSKKITSSEELSKIPKDEEEVSSSAGESTIHVVKATEKHKRRSTVSKKFKLVFPRKKFYRCLRRLTRLRVADAATVAMIGIVKYLVEEVSCLGVSTYKLCKLMIPKLQ